MTDDELTARLAWSRKQMMQRKNKPLEKHANEVFGVGVSESRESVQTGQRALAHVKAENSDADSVCREESPTPKAMCACPLCGDGFLTPITEETVTEYAGQTGKVMLRFSECEACGSEITGDKDGRENKRSVLDFRESVTGAP